MESGVVRMPTRCSKPRTKVRMHAQLGDLHGRTGIALFLLAQLKELLGVTDSKVRPCGPRAVGG